jgi:hypothetical protein
MTPQLPSKNERTDGKNEEEEESMGEREGEKIIPAEKQKN